MDEATSPFDEFAKGVISDDERAAIISVRFATDGAGNVIAYTYDALGNRLSQTTGSGTGVSSRTNPTPSIGSRAADSGTKATPRPAATSQSIVSTWLTVCTVFSAAIGTTPATRS